MPNTLTRLKKLEKRIIPSELFNMWVVMEDVDGVQMASSSGREITMPEFEKLNIPDNQVLEVIYT